jgi:hypothetical protein
LLVIQIAALLTDGVEIRGNQESFGCHNYFHGGALWSCSFWEMLLNPVEGIALFNVVTVGVPSLVAAVVVASVLAAVRRLGWFRVSSIPR